MGHGLELFTSFSHYLPVFFWPAAGPSGSDGPRNVELEQKAMRLRSVLTLALLSTAVATSSAMAQDWQNQRYQRNQQQEQQNQDACMNDAMTICGQFVPDREKVAACLLSNKNRLSAACRTMLSHWHG
jgi:hypothetical protein